MAYREQRHSDTESDADQEAKRGAQAADSEEWEVPAKKKKNVNKLRDWIEAKRWQRTDHSDQDIEVLVRAELDALNRSAGIMHLPGAHQDRVNKYGDFQYRRSWASKGDVMNFLCACPLRERCGCECEAKIAYQPAVVILFFHKAHSARDHVCERDQSKYLTFQQKSFIATAVKIAPLQTGSELIRNVQDSPTKAIDHKYKRSVDRLVRQQRTQIVNVSLEGIEIDNTVGSLARLAEALWVGDAITKHKEGETMSSDRTVFLTFTTVWNLLNFWRSVGTGYNVQLH
jgi:hypothetical protein